MENRRVGISMLGTSTDKRRSPRRRDDGTLSDVWRPNLAFATNQVFPLAVLELLVNNTPDGGEQFMRTAAELKADIEAKAPGVMVNIHPLEGHNAFKFDQAYRALYGFCHTYKPDPDKFEYLVLLNTGSHVHQICLYLLTNKRDLPGKLVQLRPPWYRNDPDAGPPITVIDLDLEQYKELRELHRDEVLNDESRLRDNIPTDNQRYNDLITRLSKVAIGTKKPILLTGPTGAGKTKLARMIFDLKKAKNLCKGEFVPVNCATLRGDMAMSELFGHTRGAFTDSKTARSGALMKANDGILFLDEIGALELPAQAMLLKAIEEKEFLPVGSDKVKMSNFHLICGTNVDLRDAIASGHFRGDLHARIKCWSFELPSLRERPEDIEPNLEFELERATREFGRPIRFTPKARSHFLGFAKSPQAVWTANFRDLNDAVERMATLAGHGSIDVTIVQEEIERLRHEWEEPLTPQAGRTLDTVLTPEKLAAIDPVARYGLEFAVETCRRSRSKAEAGRRLFAVSLGKQGNANPTDRVTRYLARFGLRWEELA